MLSEKETTDLLDAFCQAWGHKMVQDFKVVPKSGLLPAFLSSDGFICKKCEHHKKGLTALTTLKSL